MEQERLYKDLAWLWPVMSPPEDYIEEAEYLTNLIRNYLDYEPRTMLHLGCGGGHIDMTIKKHLEITGVDKSEHMLNLARKLNPENRYVLGDMRNVRLEQEYDVALLYDGVNYMANEAELKAAFKTAHANLKENGIVLTVVEQTPSTFTQNRTKVQNRTGKGIELTYIEQFYDPDPCDSTYETVFVYLIRKSGKLTVEHDLHICGMFEVEVWERLMKGIGFTPKRDTFRHSTFSPGEEYPILIGFKEGS